MWYVWTKKPTSPVGIDTATSPGIARFKLGVGGTPFILAGTYL